MECVSNHYVIRVVYRAGDVLGRVLILLLVWIFIGGLLLIVVYVYMKDWSVLKWILVTPVTTLEKRQLLDNIRKCIKCAKNRAFASNCPWPSGDIRQQLATRENILFMMILCLLIMIVFHFIIIISNSMQ